MYSLELNLRKSKTKSLSKFNLYNNINKEKI